MDHGADPMTTISEQLHLLFKPHPWHGLASFTADPGVLNAYIELVPTDSVKYEIDKGTGSLKVDRPQKYSNLCPTLYGFIPQTLCGDRVGEWTSQCTGQPGILGDGDPLDVCIFTEKNITHGDILVPAIPIGGLRMIEANQADDKILAVLQGDATYGNWREITDIPQGLLDRLRHYFLTYKELPGGGPRRVEIPQVYPKEQALDVISRSAADYRAVFGTREERLTRLLSTIRGLP